MRSNAPLPLAFVLLCAGAACAGDDGSPVGTSPDADGAAMDGGVTGDGGGGDIGDGRSCETGRACGGECVVCPEGDGIATVGCAGEGQCVVTACAVGYHTCADGCCPWQTRQLRDGAFERPSAAFGADGVLHMVAYDTEAKNLTYARLEDGEWSFDEAIDPDGLAGLYNDLAVDSDGTPHLVYLRDLDDDGAFGDTELNYARLGVGGWEIETVDAGTQVGRRPALALDPDGAPRIAYEVGVRPAHAAWTGSEWSIATDEGRSASGLDLAIDSDGVSHVAFAEFGGEVVYGTFEDDAFDVSIVNADGSPTSARLALGAGGAVHLLDSGASGPNPLVASLYDGSAWREATLGVGTLFWAESLALDERGRPHAAFIDEDGGLRYGHFTGLGWLVEDVDVFDRLTGDPVGTSIAVDGTRAHVVYVRDDGLHHAY